MTDDGAVDGRLHAGLDLEDIEDRAELIQSVEAGKRIVNDEQYRPTAG